MRLRALITFGILALAVGTAAGTMNQKPKFANPFAPRVYETIDLRSQALALQSTAIEQFGWPRPAIGNYLCGDRILAAEVDSGGKYCWQTGGIEMQQESPNELRALKAAMQKRYKRPVLVAYVNLAEYFSNITEKESKPGAWADYVARMDPETNFLHNKDGGIIPFWDPKKSVMLDLTNRETLVKLLDWTMAHHDTTVWDGIYLDNDFNEYTWHFKHAKEKYDTDIAFYEVGAEDRAHVASLRAVYERDQRAFDSRLRALGVNPEDDAAIDEAIESHDYLGTMQVDLSRSAADYNDAFDAARQREYERRCLTNVTWFCQQLRQRLGPDKFIFANSGYGNVGMQYLNGRLTEETGVNGQARLLHQQYAKQGFKPTVSVMHWSIPEGKAGVVPTRYGLTFTNVWTDDVFASDVGPNWHHYFRWDDDLYQPFGQPLMTGRYGLRDVGVRIFQHAVVFNNEGGRNRNIRVILPDGKVQRFALNKMDGYILRVENGPKTTALNQ